MSLLPSQSFIPHAIAFFLGHEAQVQLSPQWQSSPQEQPLGPVQDPQGPALPLLQVLHSQLSPHWQLTPQLQPPWHLVQVMTDLLGVFSAVGRYLSDEG